MREIAWVSPRPMCFHVLPASVDLYTPSPCMMLPRSSVSPMPRYTTSGFDSATATAPTDELSICPSVTGRHVVPADVIERPPRCGPMLRHVSALKTDESYFSATAAAAQKRTRKRDRFIERFMISGVR